MAKGKFTTVVMYIVIFVALAFSVIAVCMAAYRTPELDFDYYGVIVGVLSLLVALLMGWQIFNVIGFENRIKKVLDKHKTISTGEMNRKIQGTENKVDLKITEVNEKLVLFSKGVDVYWYFFTGLLGVQTEKYAEAFGQYINSLGLLVEMRKDNEDIEQWITMHCNILQQFMNENLTFYLKAKTKKEWIKILLSVGYERVKDILVFVEHIEIDEEKGI